MKFMLCINLAVMNKERHARHLNLLKEQREASKALNLFYIRSVWIVNKLLLCSFWKFGVFLSIYLLMVSYSNSSQPKIIYQLLLIISIVW